MKANALLLLLTITTTGFANQPIRKAVEVAMGEIRQQDRSSCFAEVYASKSLGAGGGSFNSYKLTFQCDGETRPVQLPQTPSYSYLQLASLVVQTAISHQYEVTDVKYPSTNKAILLLVAGN